MVEVSQGDFKQYFTEMVEGTQGDLKQAFTEMVEVTQGDLKQAFTEMVEVTDNHSTRSEPIINPARNTASANRELNNGSQDSMHFQSDPFKVRVISLGRRTLFNYGGNSPGLQYRGFNWVGPFAASKPFTYGEVKSPQLGLYRKPNGYTFKDCKNDITYKPFAKYQRTQMKNAFYPALHRTYEVKDPDGKTKKVVESLCPYCDEINWLRLTVQDYIYHLAVKHEVLSNGRFIPDPVDASLYYYKRRFGSQWKHFIVEAVRCPEEGCTTICKLSKPTDAHPNTAHDYLQHYKFSHFFSGKKAQQQK